MQKFRAEVEFENRAAQRKNKECVKVNGRQKVYKQVVQRLGNAHSLVKV